MDKFEHRGVIKFLTFKGLEPLQIITETHLFTATMLHL